MMAISQYAPRILCLMFLLSVCTNAADPVYNGHHIFNAIHSSMRQWGSSLNHNSVSFFRAEVPKGIKLHHGTWTADRVEGIDWLAFELEHALNFAYRPCNMDESFMTEGVRSMSPRWWPRGSSMDHVLTSQAKQLVLHADATPEPFPPLCFEPGWIHTYAPIRDLNLLYIDGTSAGTTNLGTLDSQDYVLLWNKSIARSRIDPTGEMSRAQGLCELAQQDFEGKIDGYIRMEHGFEIILCNFSLLDVVSVLRSSRDGTQPGPMGSDEFDGFSFLRAITSRYFGIGGHRVQIDYNDFVTAFSHPEIDLWADGGEQPRLNKISNDTASALLDEVKQLLLSNSKPIAERTDWQSIADMYVARYARPIQSLVSSSFNTAEAVQKELQRLFQPYLDSTSPDHDAAIKRCREAYIPTHLLQNPNASLSQRVIENSMQYLCSNLYSLLEADITLHAKKIRLQELMDVLKWTAWKDCQPGCAINEICFTTIWPFGTQQDHDQPSCLNATGLRTRFGYWDDR